MAVKAVVHRGPLRQHAIQLGHDGIKIVTRALSMRSAQGGKQRGTGIRVGVERIATEESLVLHGDG